MDKAERHLHNTEHEQDVPNWVLLLFLLLGCLIVCLCFKLERLLHRQVAAASTRTQQREPTKKDLEQREQVIKEKLIVRKWKDPNNNTVSDNEKELKMCSSTSFDKNDGEELKMCSSISSRNDNDDDPGEQHSPRMSCTIPSGCAKDNDDDDRGPDDTTLEISANNTSSCGICLTLLKNGDVIGQSSNCSHVYHVDCIKAWLLKKDECPFCRKTYLGELQQQV